MTRRALSGSAFYAELIQTALSSASPPLSLSIAAPAPNRNNGYDWTVMRTMIVL